MRATSSAGSSVQPEPWTVTPSATTVKGPAGVGTVAVCIVVIDISGPFGDEWKGRERDPTIEPVGLVGSGTVGGCGGPAPR